MTLLKKTRLLSWTTKVIINHIELPLTLHSSRTTEMNLNVNQASDADCQALTLLLGAQTLTGATP